MSNQNIQKDNSQISNPVHYNGIDLIKFFCAILVFAIHIAFFQGNMSTIEHYINFGLAHYIARLAVPFYFVVSGFFLFRKMPLDNINMETVKNYCFKMFRLWGIWAFFLFLGYSGHLWYLGATVIAILIICLCSHLKIKHSHMLMIACMLYIIGLLGTSYYGLIENIPFFKKFFDIYIPLFKTTRNGVFMGFIFVLIGATFARHKFKIKQSTSLICFFASLLCLLAEVLMLKYFDIPDSYDMYLFLVPATFFLFSFASNLKLPNHPIYAKLRTIGTLIYFSHMFINELVSFALKPFESFFKTNLNFVPFLITLTATILFSIIIEKLSRNEKFNFFKWFLA